MTGSIGKFTSLSGRVALADRITSTGRNRCSRSSAPVNPLTTRTNERLRWARPVSAVSLYGRRALSSSTPTDRPTDLEKKTAIPPNSLEQKLTFRELVSKYGAFIVMSYTGVWVLTGATCFIGVNMVGSEVVMNSLTNLGVGNYVDLSKIDPRVGNFAVAMVVNELLEPIRLPIYLSAIRPLCRKYDTWREKRNPGGIAESNTSKKASLSQLMATYGPFGFVFYTSTWAATGVATYALFSAIGPEMAIEGLNSIGIDRFVDISHLDPTMSTIAVSVLVNELLEPIRLPLVLATLVPAHKAYQNFKEKRKAPSTL